MLKIKFRFNPGHRDSSQHAPPWPLKAVFLNLTENCNMRCEYCHAATGQGHPSMPPELAERVITQAAAMGKPAIIVTGGEPMVYPHFDRIMEMAGRHGLPFKIATNGTLLGQNRVDKLLDHGARSLQISLDTLDARRYAAIRDCSPDVHREVIEGIRRCVATGKLHIAVSSVARAGAADELVDVLRFCHDEGVHTFTLYHLIPYGRAEGRDAMLDEASFKSIAETLFEAFADLPNHWAVDIGVPWAADSPFLIKWQQLLDVQPVGCIAGKTSLTILPDGTAVPCVCFASPAVSCGNAAEMDLAAIWQAPTLQYFRDETTIEGCADCSKSDFCRGGCRAIAFLASGRIDAPDPICAEWL